MVNVTHTFVFARHYKVLANSLMVMFYLMKHKLYCNAYFGFTSHVQTLTQQF